MVLPIFGIRLKKYWYVKLMWWGFFLFASVSGII